MEDIFKVIDKSRREVYLTKERWKHISSPGSPHSYMVNYLEEIKETLINPNKIIRSIYNNNKVNYYKYYKQRRQYLKIIINI